MIDWLAAAFSSIVGAVSGWVGDAASALVPTLGGFLGLGLLMYVIHVYSGGSNSGGKKK